MNCPIEEQKLYLLCDGLIDGEERTALLAHCASCPRCMGIYQEARRSLSLLKQPLTDITYIQPEKELSIISAALEQAGTGGRSPRIIVFPKKDFLYAAAAALVILSVLSGVFLLSGHGGKNAAVSTAARQRNQDRLAELTKDTTITFGNACALRVAAGPAGADVSIRQAGPRVVHFSLVKGGIFIAAHKGFYDSIAVDCRAMTVLTTGTHFSVSGNDSSVSVSVLEGAVKLLRSRAKSATAEMVLSSLEICSAKDADVQWKKERMPDSVQNQLMKNFAAMGFPDITAFPSHGIDDSEDFPQKSPPSATTGAYAEIRKKIRNGDYEKAIAALISLITARPPDPEVAYCDLALCYSKTDQWDDAIAAYAKAAASTNDSLVREAILHRTNHILFSKLLRYDDAEKGIRTYLALYPHGAWRERELRLLARVERERVQKHRQ